MPIGAVLVSRPRHGPRLRRHGARRAPRLDVRRQRPRRGGGAGDAARARRARAWSRTPRAWATLLLELTTAAGRALRGRARRARARADVGDRARAARGRRGALGCGARRARQPGLFAQLVTVPLFHEHRILCQVAGHRMNVVKALPALVVEEAEIRRFAAALEEVVAAAERAPSAMASLRAGGWPAAGGRGAAAPPRGEGARHRRRAGSSAATSSPRSRAGGAEVRAFDAGAPPHGLPAGGAGARATSSTRERWRAPSTAATRCSTWPRSTAIRARDAGAMGAVNVEGTRAVLDAAARGASGAGSSTPARARPAGPWRGGRRPRPTRRRSGSSRCPTSGPSSRASAWRWPPRARARDVVVVNPTTPVGPGDRRPTPTGKMIADVAAGRAPRVPARARRSTSSRSRTSPRATCSPTSAAAPASATCSAARTCPCATCSRSWPSAAGRRRRGSRSRGRRATPPRGRPTPRCAPIGREPSLLVLDEVRLARLPMSFDDARARGELGYRSRPAAGALAEAARAAAAREA